MDNSSKKGIGLAVLAAALYAVNSPFSKVLLAYVPSTLMAGLLYIGAGCGMVLLFIFRKLTGRKNSELNLTKQQLPYVIGMIVLDIAAPICLLYGLSKTTAANASLLNNFEIVATSLIAYVLFQEKISPRLCFGILFVTLSCMVLSFEDISAFHFSTGSLFVILAASCWGLENNCTRCLSEKDPLQIVLLKGIFSGTGSLIIGLVLHERISDYRYIIPVLILGFVAYGLSIYFYVFAQRVLGASRTSAYYAIAPFIGALLSLLIFQQIPPATYLFALALMIIGAWLCSSDEPLHFKRKK